MLISSRAGNRLEQRWHGKIRFTQQMIAAIEQRCKYKECREAFEKFSVYLHNKSQSYYGGL
jgi:hypothetical protein